MKLRYHFSRQRRQLAHLAKRLTQQTEAGRLVTTAQLAKLKNLAGYLAPRIGGVQVRRVMGAGLFLLASAGVQAQTFAAPVANPFGLDPSANFELGYAQGTLADMDGDGDLDFLASAAPSDETSTTSLFYQENTGTATVPEFGDSQTNPFGFVGVIDGGTISAADIDGDGDIDLLITGRDYAADPDDGIPTDVFYENIGTAEAPAFAAGVLDGLGLTPLPSAGNFLFPAFGDIDGDGDLDVIGQQYDGRIDQYGSYNLYYENISTEDGEIAFAEPVDDAFGLDLYIFDVFTTLGDIDNDGDLDLIGGNFNYGTEEDTYANGIVFIENTGTATTPEFAEQVENPFGIVPIQDTDGLGFLFAGDIDGDDDLDLFLLTDSGLFYYENLDPVSVRDQFVNIPATLSPNPTGGEVAITTDVRIESVEVFNGLGQRVISQTGNNNRVDLTGLPAGTYTFQFLLEDGKFGTRRVVKQ